MPGRRDKVFFLLFPFGLPNSTSASFPSTSASPNPKHLLRLFLPQRLFLFSRVIFKSARKYPSNIFSLLRLFLKNSLKRFFGKATGASFPSISEKDCSRTYGPWIVTSLFPNARKRSTGGFGGGRNNGKRSTGAV